MPNVKMYDDIFSLKVRISTVINNRIDLEGLETSGECRAGYIGSAISRSKKIALKVSAALTRGAVTVREFALQFNVDTTNLYRLYSTRSL
ncbi:hypothetical protein DICVIV_01062 [Dictyocaulus viviparus]|uniref:Uncharacterized protein n=1 Tax=Dictyocaulus viviparus TaxID=29172 RepID=A0A0D8Y7B4_DICVI|nr:hypothetical protein DICVIV_01062 [Dictyocaulus viviparus]